MDFSSLLGGGNTQPGGKGNSTAATIFGGYNQGNQLSTSMPWLIGGAAVIVIAFAMVLIAALRR